MYFPSKTQLVLTEMTGNEQIITEHIEENEETLLTQGGQGQKPKQSS